jgi:hypothetical protein
MITNAAADDSLSRTLKKIVEREVEHVSCSLPSLTKHWAESLISS